MKRCWLHSRSESHKSLGVRCVPRGMQACVFVSLAWTLTIEAVGHATGRKRKSRLAQIVGVGIICCTLSEKTNGTMQGDNRDTTPLGPIGNPAPRRRNDTRPACLALGELQDCHALAVGIADCLGPTDAERWQDLPGGGMWAESRTGQIVGCFTTKSIGRTSAAFVSV